eukprot:5139059-Amphidinium_carterae.1
MSMKQFTLRQGQVRRPSVARWQGRHGNTDSHRAGRAADAEVKNEVKALLMRSGYNQGRQDGHLIAICTSTTAVYTCATGQRQTHQFSRDAERMLGGEIGDKFVVKHVLREWALEELQGCLTLPIGMPLSSCSRQNAFM